MDSLTDLEITRACAEAMELEVRHVSDNEPQHTIRVIRTGAPYFPLTNDAQAMALVKRIGLTCMWSRGGWEVSFSEANSEFCKSHAMHMDLNRAICLCVAQMQTRSKP